MQSASSFLQTTLPQVEKALEELKEGETKLSNRNKLILITDSSNQGWEVVNEYQRRDPADDSDDDKRIKQAESRAFQKRRRAQSTKKSSYSSQWSSNLAFPSLSYVMPAYSSPAPLFQPLLSPAFSRNSFNTTNWPNSRGGSCFGCGRFGHYRNQCPDLNAQLSVNLPSKRS